MTFKELEQCVGVEQKKLVDLRNDFEAFRKFDFVVKNQVDVSIDEELTKKINSVKIAIEHQIEKQVRIAFDKQQNKQPEKKPAKVSFLEFIIKKAQAALDKKK